MLVLIVYEKWPSNGRREATSSDNHFTRAAKIRIIFQIRTGFFDVPFMFLLGLEKLVVAVADLPRDLEDFLLVGRNQDDVRTRCGLIDLPELIGYQ